MCIVCSLRRNICSSWESSLLTDEKEEEDGSGGGSIIVGIITEFWKNTFSGRWDIVDFVQHFLMILIIYKLSTQYYL